MFGLTHELLCFLCDAHMHLEDAVLLLVIISNQEQLCMILIRFGQRSYPSMCKACGALSQNAKMRAAYVLNTSLGQDLYRTAQAFFRRDRSHIASLFNAIGSDVQSSSHVAELPCDEDGRLHPHVCSQQTSTREPFVGRTAEIARAQSRKGEAHNFESQATLAMGWYTYKGHLAITGVTPIYTVGSRDVVTDIVKRNLSASSVFFSSFIYIFLLSMEGSEHLHDALVSRLEECWNTLYAVAMIVSALLDVDLATTKISKTKPLLYGFLYLFPFFSPSVQAISNLGCEGESKQLQRPAENFQSFMCCELGKCANLYRTNWQELYTDFDARIAWVTDKEQSYIMVWPAFRKEADDNDAECGEVRTSACVYGATAGGTAADAALAAIIITIIE